MQTINNTEEYAECSKCGTNLMELGKFTYDGVTVNTARHKEEQCQCRACETKFILRYEFFDENDHIQTFVFNNDVNDPTYNWQDQLTIEQKQEIGGHLNSCLICKDRLNEETLADAWIACLIHEKK